MKKKQIALILLIGLLCLQSTARNKQPLPTAPKAECEKYKAAGDMVMNLINGNIDEELHGLIVLKDGKKVYESYCDGHTPKEQHVMWSASKTMLCMAVGFAVDEGLIHLDDKMVSFFSADELPAPDQRHEYLDSITIRHLLTMTTGWEKDYPILVTNRLLAKEWLRPQLASGFVAEPGKRQAYHSGSTFTLSAIITKVTGLTLADYLDKKLFRHIGVRDYICQTSPEGYGAAAWGFYMNTESFAKLGQFMLQKGEWKGRQLLSREWVEEATLPHVTTYMGHESEYTPEKWASLENTTWDQKWYGYQLWINRDKSYRFHGAYGQLCLVFPERGIVVAVTAHARNDLAIINAIFDHILKVQ